MLNSSNYYKSLKSSVVQITHQVKKGTGMGSVLF